MSLRNPPLLFSDYSPPFSLCFSALITCTRGDYSLPFFSLLSQRHKQHLFTAAILKYRARTFVLLQSIPLDSARELLTPNAMKSSSLIILLSVFNVIIIIVFTCLSFFVFRLSWPLIIVYAVFLAQILTSGIYCLALHGVLIRYAFIIDSTFQNMNAKTHSSWPLPKSNLDCSLAAGLVQIRSQFIDQFGEMERFLKLGIFGVLLFAFGLSHAMFLVILFKSNSADSFQNFSMYSKFLPSMWLYEHLLFIVFLLVKSWQPVPHLRWLSTKCPKLKSILTITFRDNSCSPNGISLAEPSKERLIDE